MIKLILLGSILFLSFSFKKEPSVKTLKYIAFGDSYTICTGTSNINEHWPNMLAKELTKSNVKTELIVNPSKNGFTTQDVIDNELPLIKNKTIDLATLLIGVNDWVRGVDANNFHKNLNFIIDEIQKKLTNKSYLFLITIPDFGMTPQGAMYSGGRNITDGITEFNDIIKFEAKKRKLVCIDIFPLSKNMLGNNDLIASDGLHPSAKEYALWNSLIFNEVKKVLLK